MDDFARFAAADRADLFRTVATGRGLNPAIVEKDFWACWTLKRLFSLNKPPAGLLFKGGTSLSKVFKAIERFSEDIDISFDRGGLGFGGKADPMAAATGKQRQRGLDALAERCRQAVQAELLPQLKDAFRDALAQEPSPQGWDVELAADDPGQQTVVFRYPPSSESRPGNEPAYIRPMVRLEIGARSEHWPAIEATVIPYVAEDYPAIFKLGSCAVHVLAAERTFWEKATILHAWHHAPADRPLRDRQSRHYYDVVRMYEHGIGKAAMKDTGLLVQVARHKEAFFAAAWARYAEARPGTLRLVPPDARLPEIKRDYQSMREMIFGEPPVFEHLLAVLRQIEDTVNTA